jgi:hypothetical protein
MTEPRGMSRRLKRYASAATETVDRPDLHALQHTEPDPDVDLDPDLDVRPDHRPVGTLVGSVPAAWTIDEAPAAMIEAGGVLLVELTETDLADRHENMIVLSTDRSLSSVLGGDPLAGDVLALAEAPK